MAKFVISSELTSNNFSNDILLEKNSLQVVERKDTPIKEVQEFLNDYIYTVANINVKSLIKVNRMDWGGTQDLIERAFIKIGRIKEAGYIIHHENCSEIWYYEGVEIKRVCVKVKEIKKKDCLMISPLMTKEIHLLPQRTSINMLDSLWEVTQLFEIDKLTNNRMDIKLGRELTDPEYNNHLDNLWVNRYERCVENIEGTYVYSSMTKNQYTPNEKENFNNTITPKTYYFPKINLDYNDYNMQTGKLIEYTNLDYADNIQQEHSLLAIALRSEDDLTQLF
tara:strand:- start:110 stop:949 length:840 start_codon:yes stop_codon:yes gene_type:complete